MKAYTRFQNDNMNFQQADRLSLVKPSPTLAVSALANRLKAEGKDVVGFGAGEPDFDTPAHIKEAAKKALDAGKTKYTPVAGIPSLREAVAEKFKKDNGFDFQSSDVVIGVGGKQILYNLFMAVLNHGDEIIIPSPYWVSYNDMALLAGASVKFIETDIHSGYKITAEQLEKAITPKSKIFLMNSPSNPTGSAYTKEELAKLAEVLKKHEQILIVTDDIYEKLIYDDFAFYNLPMAAPELLERSVVINGLSKAYSMTGWRLGYAASKQQAIIKGMITMQGQSTSNATSFAQAGGEAALREDQSCIDDMKKEFVKRRDYLLQELSAIDGIKVQKPQGAFYVFPDFSGLIDTAGFQALKKEHLQANPSETSNSKILAQVLLEKYLVAVVPGIAFGYDNGFRMSYAVSMEQNKKGMERIAELFRSWK